MKRFRDLFFFLTTPIVAAQTPPAARPAIDLEIPDRTETATFALG